MDIHTYFMKILIIPTLALLGFVACKPKELTTAPVKLVWELGENGAKENAYSNSFTITNNSDEVLDANWAIYYNQIHTNLIQEEECGIKIEEIKTNFYKISPTSSYEAIKPGDSLVIPFYVKGRIIKESRAPEGAYYVKYNSNKEEKIFPLKLEVRPFKLPVYEKVGQNLPPYPNGIQVYQDNSRFSANVEVKPTDIFPSIKKVVQKEGSISIDGRINLIHPDIFQNEAAFLTQKMKDLYNIQIDKEAPISIELKLSKFEETNPEYYHLTIKDNKIQIESGDAHGIFNGIQTLFALIHFEKLPIQIPNLVVSDYPDLMYRGLMYDVARNFTNKNNLLKLIDRMASYKLNVLHLHLSDDEGWRLEIPGIEELTTVGATRAHTLDESKCLYPNYSGGAFPSELGTGYYSVNDFIEILQYAKTRHISVIPEIDLPGHARAAIKAMLARYNKYNTADKTKAEEYLLTDFNDQSVYTSAQGYTDNVINIALPSAYAFSEKIIDEIIKMYAQAEVPLVSFHIGGDEVPKGSWEKSALCKKFMEQEGIANTADLHDYFLEKMAGILKSKGVKVATWQEGGLNRDESINMEHLGRINILYCWNTLPDWNGDRIPYSLANAGYNIVLSNLTNFYFDLSYSSHKDEPGHQWAGFINEYSSFNMLPFNLYHSTRKTLSGTNIDLNTAPEGKPELNKEAKNRILGVQGQLFAETIRSYEMSEYYLFPKMFGLVERGWNSSPSWGNNPKDWNNNPEYENALLLYNAKIAKKELPRLQREGVNFRVSPPGIILHDGKLYANSAVPGVEIRYTTDGSEPNKESTLWTAPVDCSASVIKAKSFYLGKESVTIQ